MSAAITLALLGATLLLVPGRPTRRRAPPDTRAAPFDDAQVVPDRSRPALIVSVGGLACACLALLGARTGAVVAVVVCPVAAIVLRMLQRRPVRLRIHRSVALTLDLAAAALRTGRPLADALTAAAPAAEPAVRDALQRVAGLLRLGAEPAQAWAVVAADGPLGSVAVAAVRSATSGIRLAAGFERLADEIRVEVSAASVARAHRAGVVAMAPLGACFLPSFVCLGIVPVVVGIAKTATGVVP